MSIDVFLVDQVEHLLELCLKHGSNFWHIEAKEEFL